MEAYTKTFALSERDIKKISSAVPLKDDERPIRFVAVDDNTCEMDVMSVSGRAGADIFSESIFTFEYRQSENTDKFVAVLLIPTGINAAIGGACGDGGVVARLIASACDTLITHPNVVNASDINEMAENTLYVEGSMITRLMMGRIGLEPTRSNRILVLMDKHPDPLFNDEIVNAVSSARVTMGLNCDVIQMEVPIKSVSKYTGSGRATGHISHLERLIDTIRDEVPVSMFEKNKYDAVGLSTFIDVDPSYHTEYFKNGVDMVNPWGGIEAMITHAVSYIYSVPCAHSPMMTSREVMDEEVGIIDPRKAPESASVTFLQCILKGLHRSPRIVDYNKHREEYWHNKHCLKASDVSCLIIPGECVGLPMLAALEQGIPIIVVEGNTNCMRNTMWLNERDNVYCVDNYLEAVGMMECLKAGIDPRTMDRPISSTVRNVNLGR